MPIEWSKPDKTEPERDQGSCERKSEIEPTRLRTSKHLQIEPSLEVKTLRSRSGVFTCHGLNLIDWTDLLNLMPKNKEDIGKDLPIDEAE